MTLLLNWRVWAALIFAVVEATAGYKLHHAGYLEGKTEVGREFSAYRETALQTALAAQAASVAKERAMETANLKVTENYESLKTATSTAVRALDSDRLRLQAALASRSRPTPGDPAAVTGTAQTPEVGILSECLQRYEAVASDADTISDQLKALQDYVNNVVPK